jgi:translocation and assembly module TamB
MDGNIEDNSLGNLQILGQTKLTNFRVGSLNFDPSLSGNIRANPGQGVDIDFSGNRDRLALSLDRNLQLEKFIIDRQGVIAKGTVTDESSPTEKRRILDINIAELPLSLLQPWIPKSVGIEQYRFNGTATGNLAINMNNFQVAGKKISIINPTFGAFQGDLLLANFNYDRGKIQIANTEIHKGANTYVINANLDSTAATPTFQAKLQVPKGSIEDVRNLVQIFSNEDLFTPLNQRSYGTVADLYPQTKDRLANRPQPLYNELRRLSELRRWLNRETDRQQANNPLPDIGNLQGDFSGEISIANHPQTGFSTDFNVDATNWHLERYYLDRLQAKGSWRNGELHLAPLTLTIDRSQMTLSGKMGANNQSASINIQNFPAQWLTGFTKPVDINGGIYLAAQISGDATNPQILGNLVLHDGQLNNTKLQYAGGSFNYHNGQLTFDSDATFIKRLLPNREDRIKIAGSIPYQIPFTKAPTSNAIKIDLSVDNQGLQILDVFSNQQLHWIDGDGKIAVKIEGKMKPTGEVEGLWANGTAKITNGKIQSIALPAPLTDINGEIVFDFDRIDVQKLVGKLAGAATTKDNRGSINIGGIIPISESFSIEPSRQLNIQISGINANLPDKYNGGVDGNLTILGTAFKPILTGELKLSNGQVLLSESPNTTSTILGIQPLLSEEDNLKSLQLSKLQLTLGDNLQIVRAPILNFIATGKIDIDGTLDRPRPFGTVQLLKGSVNLFTTQFRLASGTQTADFVPTLGTEPVLNLRLYSKILQSTSSAVSQRNSIARTNSNGEINRPAEFYTTSLGSVQTIQVEARIAGLASQITQRLELTSSPSLSQSEILLLLGGGLVQQIGSGENIGLGIVNLAGSNLLSTLQDRIGDVLNLSDFRLFPTIVSKSSTNTASNLGIAAEIGTEIAPNLSTSVFKILTNSESLYYSLRYRLNDRLLLRGSTNLYGENRAIIEFEQRF